MFASCPHNTLQSIVFRLIFSWIMAPQGTLWQYFHSEPDDYVNKSHKRVWCKRHLYEEIDKVVATLPYLVANAGWDPNYMVQPREYRIAHGASQMCRTCLCANNPIVLQQKTLEWSTGRSDSMLKHINTCELYSEEERVQIRAAKKAYKDKNSDGRVADRRQATIAALAHLQAPLPFPSPIPPSPLPLPLSSFAPELADSVSSHSLFATTTPSTSSSALFSTPQSAYSPLPNSTAMPSLKRRRTSSPPTPQSPPFNQLQFEADLLNFFIALIWRGERSWKRGYATMGSWAFSI